MGEEVGEEAGEEAAEEARGGRQAKGSGVNAGAGIKRYMMHLLQLPSTSTLIL